MLVRCLGLVCTWERECVCLCLSVHVGVHTSPRLHFVTFFLRDTHTCISILGGDEMPDFPDVRNRVALPWNHEWQCELMVESIPCAPREFS